MSINLLKKDYDIIKKCKISGTIKKISDIKNSGMQKINLENNVYFFDYKDTNFKVGEKVNLILDKKSNLLIYYLSNNDYNNSFEYSNYKFEKINLDGCVFLNSNYYLFGSLILALIIIGVLVFKLLKNKK